MKAAILGAGGALGARLIESFELGDGPSVAAIARAPSDLASAGRFAIDLRLADVLDIDSLARSFSGCSVAVHAIAVGLADLKGSVSAFCRAGAQSGLRRLIYVSTADVHGLSPSVGTDEKSPLHVRHDSPRVNALVAADLHFSAECRQLGLSGLVLRPSATYGPRCAWFDGIVSELQENRAWLAHHGDGICNCVYIDHVVTAIRLGLRAKISASAAYIVTDEETITWRKFYEAVAQELHLLESIHVVEGAPTEAASKSSRPTPAPTFSPETLARHHCAWKFPSTRADQDLAIKPVATFAERIHRSVAWWRFAQGDFAAA
jgi:nucleoside-diphosphate-sugar epimerase